MENTNSPPAFPSIKELLDLGHEDWPDDVAPRGAYAIDAWLDELDPATAERVARVLTNRASQALIARARGRATARIAAGKPWADHKRIAAEQGITVAALRRLITIGRESLAVRGRYKETVQATADRTAFTEADYDAADFDGEENIR